MTSVRTPDASDRLPRIDSIADIEAIESVPLAERGLPESTYEMLLRGASEPDAPALSFFLDAAGFDAPVSWTHEEFLQDIRRTANALRRLGVERDGVVAFILPNLPETHLTIWGAETAGIAFAINPLLDAAHIAELLRAGNASWVVTLAPTPGADLREKVSGAAAEVASLRGILTVDLAPYAPEAHRAPLAALAATAGGTWHLCHVPGTWVSRLKVVVQSAAARERMYWALPRIAGL